MLIGGLFLPITVSIWGGIYILARFGYICAYLQAPKKRQMFVPIIAFTQLMMPLFSGVCCVVFYFNVPTDGIDNIKSGLFTGFWNSGM